MSKTNQPVLWLMPDGKTVDKWARQFYRDEVGIPLYEHPKTEDEPVAIADGSFNCNAPLGTPLYARPQPVAQFAGSYGTIDESAARRIATALGWKPPFSWVGLTQQDIDIAFDDTQEGGGFNEFARAIEAKLREKNGGKA